MEKLTQVSLGTSGHSLGFLLVRLSDSWSFDIGINIVDEELVGCRLDHIHLFAELGIGHTIVVVEDVLGQMSQRIAALLLVEEHHLPFVLLFVVSLLTVPVLGVGWVHAAIHTEGTAVPQIFRVKLCNTVLQSSTNVHTIMI